MDNAKLDVIKNLKPGERVEITASTEQVAELQLISFKIRSYQNLFSSFMTRTEEKANEFSLQKFVDDFTEITVREYFLLKSIVEAELGEEGFNMVSCSFNQLKLNIDDHNAKLYVVNNASMQESCDCSEQQ